MLFDNSSLREQANDQAEGLRQLRRSGSASGACGHLVPWPRLVLISEFPGTDMGARFAFHLAHALGSHAADGTAARTLLVDLAPAASRAPHVLADLIPADRYPPLWSELAAGRSLSTIDLGDQMPVAVAAESQMTPASIDQLPRLYEQFVRQLSRHVRWQWIVLLALDNIVPLDRPCWQAADDIVLLGNPEASGCQRQAAAVRSRLAEADPQRRLWSLPTHSASPYSRWRFAWRPSWRSGWRPSLEMRSDGTEVARRWLDAGLAPRLLPASHWPRAAADGQLRQGTRADLRLVQSARQVASALHAATLDGAQDGCEDSSDLVKLSGLKKKIQLGAQLRPITQLSEMFRA
jgi:hypothetical protein